MGCNFQTLSIEITDVENFVDVWLDHREIGDGLQHLFACTVSKPPYPCRRDAGRDASCQHKWSRILKNKHGGLGREMLGCQWKRIRLTSQHLQRQAAGFKQHAFEKAFQSLLIPR